MSDSLSLLEEASLEEGNAVGRRVIFNAYGSFVGENEDNMGEEETDHVAEVCKFRLLVHFLSFRKFISHKLF